MEKDWTPGCQTAADPCSPGVKQKTGSAIRALVGRLEELALLELCSGELGTRWGKCPGVGPIASVDLSGGWFPGLGRTGSPGLAGLVLGPGHPLGLQRLCQHRPVSVRGGCCSHLRIQLHSTRGRWPGLGRPEPLPVSCLFATTFPDGISEGSVPRSRSGSCSCTGSGPLPLGSPLPLAALSDCSPEPAGIASLSASCASTLCRKCCGLCLPALAPASWPLLHPCTVPA